MTDNNTITFARTLYGVIKYPMDGAGKTIGIIAREPAAEALRMALGMTTLSHEVIVFIADHVLKADDMTRQHLEALELMGARLMSNHSGNPFEQVSFSEAARLMGQCDMVIPY